MDAISLQTHACLISKAELMSPLSCKTQFRDLTTIFEHTHVALVKKPWICITPWTSKNQQLEAGKIDLTHSIPINES